MLFVLKDCTRPFPIAALLEADHLSTLVPLWLAADREIEAVGMQKGLRPSTDVPKLWASNDRRYASFQRHVAYIKILRHPSKNWRQAEPEAAPRQPPGSGHPAR